MSGHHPFSRLRREVLARPGATERLGRLRAATLDDIDHAQADDRNRREVDPAVRTTLVQRDEYPRPRTSAYDGPG